eukprot:730851-Pelagomonas_calceolata.AAC.1
MLRGRKSGKDYIAGNAFKRKAYKPRRLEKKSLCQPKGRSRALRKGSLTRGYKGKWLQWGLTFSQ